MDATVPVLRRWSLPTLDGGVRSIVAGRAGLLRHLPVAALVTAYVVRFSLLSVQVYDGYGTPAYDMAIPDQALWQLSRFHAPFSSVMGRNFFADHTSFTLVLLVPLYWVYDHAAALLVVQALTLGATAIPIYTCARRRLGDTVSATLLAAAYLFEPALQDGNLEQWHIEALTVPFVALAVVAALERRPRLLAVSAVLLLLCKEDTALLVVPLGLWVAWRRDREWGVRLVAGAVAWTLVATYGVIYTLEGVTNVHSGRVPFGGLGATVRTLIRRPAVFSAYIRSGGRPFYVWQMLFPTGLTIVRAPSVALIGILTVTVNVVTSFGYEHQIQYHYSLPLVPVLSLGTVWAVGTLATTRQRRVAAGIAAACSLWACVLWGLAPFSDHQYPHTNPDSPQVHATDRVLAALPADAVVSAYYPYVAHIDHREGIYMWPNPFRAEYWDDFRQEGTRLPFADRIDWLVLPSGLTGGDGAVLASVRPEFHVVRQDGGVVLWERNGTTGR